MALPTDITDKGNTPTSLMDLRDLLRTEGNLEKTMA